MSGSRIEEANAYLRRDPFANVTALKMLATYAAQSTVQLDRDASGAVAGLRLTLPTAAFAYDRTTYPDADSVVLLAADSPARAGALLDSLPRDGRFVFKLADPAFAQEASRRFDLVRARAFVSYGAPPHGRWQAAPDVASGADVAEPLLPLFAQQGYDEDEVRRLMSTQDGRWYAVAAQGRPLAACLTFRNFDPVYEVGALFTDPAARRCGLARKVVETALADLRARGLLPRYQVESSNAGSAALAEAVGLRRFVVLEHWVGARR
jgi:GNAT superfamily N-acetyltransferase